MPTAGLPMLNGSIAYLPQQQRRRQRTKCGLSKGTPDYAPKSAILRYQYGAGFVEAAARPSAGIMAARSKRLLKGYSNSAR
jgi:hypothetical protein